MSELPQERVLSSVVEEYHMISTEPRKSIQELEDLVMSAHPKIPKGFFVKNIPNFWYPDEYANYLIDNPDTENVNNDELNEIWDEYYWYSVYLKKGYRFVKYGYINPTIAIQFDDFPEDDDADMEYIKKRTILKNKFNTLEDLIDEEASDEESSHGYYYDY